MAKTEQKPHDVANAEGWLESIREMVAKLDTEDDNEREKAQEEIRESVLSVETRSDWHSPGEEKKSDAGGQFNILLTTGGPALRMIGALDEHCEPESPTRLEYQDWGTPWTPLPMSGEDEDICKRFAACFYFGE